MQPIIDQFTQSFLPIGIAHNIQPGSTGKFSGMDSEDDFKKNLLIQPADWHYRTKDVTYTVNSSGYRAPEWDTIDWANSVVIFGCSHVVGIGLAEDETIGYQLSKLLDRPVINLGVGGSGPMFSHQNSVLLHKNFPKPWAVVQIWSGPDRISEFESDRSSLLPSHFHGPWTTKSTHEGWQFYRAWTQKAATSIIYNHFAVIATAAIWESRTRYFSGSFWPAADSATIKLRMIDKARDVSHPGRQTAIIVAKTIANVLNAQ